GIIMILSDIIDHLKNHHLINIKSDTVKSIISEVKPYLDHIILFIKELEEIKKIELKSSYGTGGETKYWRTFQKIIQETYPIFQPDGLDDYFKKEAKLFNDKAISYIR